MKIRIMVLTCLVAVIVLSMGYEATQMPFIAFGSSEYNQAGSKSETKAAAAGAKIGVVSIRKIFQDCKKNARYREETAAEQNKVISELERLSKEIEAEKAGLATLKAGSSDHTALVKEILLKQASLQARQEFYKQQLSLKDQRWTEELYQEILRITREVAEQKGLGLVFVKGEVELPALSANELMLTIRTHKLLYEGGCLDITDEVMARLDKEK